MHEQSIRPLPDQPRRNPRAGHRMAAVAFLVIAVAGFTVSCAPEVGSEAWCSEMKNTPKGDWSGNQAVDFAKHCLFE